jgi:polar amino acid transport system substrate-binding protein
METIKKLRLFLLIAIGILFFLTSCHKDALPEKPIRASGHEAWGPAMFVDSTGKKIIGVAPDLATMVADELGLEIAVSYAGSWETVQQKIATGELDLVVSAYINEEREKNSYFTVPFMTDPVSIFVKKGSGFPLESWEELLTKKGVAMTGDSYGKDFDKFRKDNNLNMVSVGTPAEAFALISNGSADYFIYARYSGEIFMARNNLGDSIEILNKNISEEKFYMMISKKSWLVEYIPQINQIIEKKIADGTVDRLIKQWKLK